MASASTYPSWTLNGGTIYPNTSKSNPEFICNYLSGISKQTHYSMSLSAYMKTSPSWRQQSSSLTGGFGCRAVDVETKPFFSLGTKFHLEDVIEAQQFDRDTLSAIFDVTMEMEKIEKNSPGSQILKGYLMSTLFYEPSTRTRLSFESAMKRLGGEVLTTENAREFSSAAKGETLEGIQYMCFGK